MKFLLIRICESVWDKRQEKKKGKERDSANVNIKTKEKGRWFGDGGRAKNYCRAGQGSDDAKGKTRALR